MDKGMIRCSYFTGQRVVVEMEEQISELIDHGISIPTRSTFCMSG
jgi:hypothetical protein